MTADRFHLLLREVRNAEFTAAQRLRLMEEIQQDALRSENAYVEARIAIDQIVRNSGDGTGDMTTTCAPLKAGR